jgi:solute carrier family 7 (L-type amino acid transporter), member 9/15
VLIFPFVRPVDGVGDTPPLPYYLYCLIGIAVTIFGVLYWAVWKLVLPYVFKFRLVPRKELLRDGTVVVLVSWRCCYHESRDDEADWHKFSREKIE